MLALMMEVLSLNRKNRDLLSINHSAHEIEEVIAAYLATDPDLDTQCSGVQMGEFLDFLKQDFLPALRFFRDSPPRPGLN